MIFPSDIRKFRCSVVHEPARVSWHPALGGSNRGPRAESSPLATRAGSDRVPRADSTLDSSLFAVPGRPEPARIGLRLGLSSAQVSSPGVICTEPAQA